MDFLCAYPIATVSTAAFYLLMLAIAVPRSRRVIAPWFVHPVAPHQRYQLGFDTLRGFAAALVAFGHCWWATYPLFQATVLNANFIAYSSKGVPIFGVLSGFLIYRSVLGAVSNTAQLRAYIIRRFFRIYPVYLLGIALCLMTGQYVVGQGFTPVSYLVSDLFMFASLNWPGGFANPPTWSLYIEVAFYAVLPLMVIVVGERRMMALSVMLLVAWILADHPSRIFTLWRYFFIGIIASEVAKRVTFWPGVLGFTVGVGLVIYDMGGPDYDWIGNLGIGLVHLDGSTLGLGLGCGLILASLPQLPIAGAALNILPLRLLGVISYSVYIVQFFYVRANFPEIGLFNQAGTELLYQQFKMLPPFPAWYLPAVFFPGVLFWGAVSFVLVERPGIRFGQFLLTRNKKRTEVADPGRVAAMR